jgi:hypothetical protein
MADEIDMANEQAQMILDRALAYRKPVPSIHPVGQCHWCEEDLEGLKLFCGSDCATRYNRYHKI